MIYMSHVARHSITRHMRLIISVIQRCATCSEQTTFTCHSVPQAVLIVAAPAVAHALCLCAVLK